MELVTTLALAGAALVAGTIDAIAGGGGLITLPSLLAAGLPTNIALGTNKGQSSFGSFSALVNFWRAGAIDARRAPVSFLAGFVGSLAGARLVVEVPPATLRPVVLVMLLGVAAALTFRPDLANIPEDAAPKELSTPRAAAIAGVIGAYDGFFGPGTGTFLIMAYVTWMRDPLIRASANAKVVNFASNLAALAIFSWRGVVRWEVALPMALAQFAGGALGARLTLWRGNRFVRVVVLIVVAALVLKLAVDIARAR